MAKKATPLMQQYNRVKADYPEALLLSGGRFLRNLETTPLKRLMSWTSY